MELIPFILVAEADLMIWLGKSYLKSKKNIKKLKESMFALPIIDVKAANDLDSLFNMGSDVLFSGNIKGLDDFELITFIVVK